MQDLTTFIYFFALTLFLHSERVLWLSLCETSFVPVRRMGCMYK